MATSTNDWRGIVIELDHAETQNLMGTLAGLAGAAAPGAAVVTALVAIGVAAPIAAIVAAVLAADLAIHIPLIKGADAGEGVILTIPPFPPGIMIPVRRYGSHIPRDWAAEPNGIFVSVGNDQVRWAIEHNVAPPGEVVFRIVNQCQSGWDKILVLRDGQGGRWELKATPNAAGENGLYDHQCQNGQQITFRKPSFLGGWINVFSVGGLEHLHGGDKVTFTWVLD